jgi:hypothetical protein
MTWIRITLHIADDPGRAGSDIAADNGIDIGRLDLGRLRPGRPPIPQVYPEKMLDLVALPERPRPKWWGRRS